VKVAVIGTGYVGLVTGTCLAESGNDVVCVDNNPKKIATLNDNRIPIYEPGLHELVLRNKRDGRLTFTTDLAAAVKSARLVFIAVGTPQSAEGDADLTAVFAVADAIGDALKGVAPGKPGDRVVITKSTVPVGTNAKVAERLAAKGCAHIDVASNPEFLKEGAAIDDFMKPDRVVVGVRKPEVGEALHELYAPFLRTERPFIVMTPESAEMTKYAANAMLATKISFINEMANLCDRLGADINDVRKGIGHDQRIGFQFLFPGPGYGGSCFAAEETVFVVEPDGVRAKQLRALFDRVAQRVGISSPVAVGTSEEIGVDEGVAVLPPPDEPIRVLAWDSTRGRAVLSEVHALTRRPFRGEMIDIRTGMNRRLRVTGDHPVIVWADGREEVIPAAEVQPGHKLAALHALPETPVPAALDLTELLAGTTLEKDVLVVPTDDSFTARYSRYARHISPDMLRHPLEIKDNNRMRLSLFRFLRDRGLIDVPAERLQLYTAKGAGTRLNALVPVDEDFARLCGYYLAEGFISKDVGRAGAIRHRVGFCFHVAEAAYIADVQRILRKLGLKFIETGEGNSHTTLVSSRVFAWLLRDVLECGVRSDDKVLPAFALAASRPVRMELVRGAFSGDGAVTPVQNGKNLMFEYATVSKRLADGMALLLQSLGVVVSVRRRMMNKSTMPAYVLRVSGHEQLSALREAFGDKHRERIRSILAGYSIIIKPHGYERRGDVSLLTVRSVESESVESEVYSLETSHGTVIASSGLVCHNCFPKDVEAIIAMGRHTGLPLKLMQAVDEVNDAQKEVLYHKVWTHFAGQLAGKTIALWGLAFKPRTDDIREAPALTLVEALLKAGAKVRVHDPEAMANVREIFGDKLYYADRPYGALEGADGLVVVTEWQEFRTPDFEVMKRLLAGRVIFDGRNIYDHKQMTSLGFTYYGIGRGHRAESKKAE
jgi:UDPglucose 6-dehydrogenase